MRLPLASLLAAIAVVRPSEAGAVGPVEGDVSLGFALPVGSLERGSRVGDTTSGMVPLQLDGALFLTPRLALHLSGSFALAIPKLCATASDCESSLGRDVSIDAGVRLAFPDLGRVAPRIDLGIGWEWYSTTLSDGGISSTRAYAGPTLIALNLTTPFHLSRRFALGPSLGARVGAFTSVTRTTPAWSDSSLDGKALHAWFRVGLDARFTF